MRVDPHAVVLAGELGVRGHRGWEPLRPRSVQVDLVRAGLPRDLVVHGRAAVERVDRDVEHIKALRRVERAVGRGVVVDWIKFPPRGWTTAERHAHMSIKKKMRQPLERAELDRRVMRGAADVISPPTGVVTVVGLMTFAPTADDRERARVLRDRLPGLRFEPTQNDRNNGKMHGKWIARSRVPGREAEEVVHDVDHVACSWERLEVRERTEADDGLLWRRVVKVRDLLEKDINRNCSGYEYIRMMRLEDWFKTFYATAFCEVVPRTVNGTGHTGPSRFCATSS